MCDRCGDWRLAFYSGSNRQTSSNNRGIIDQTEQNRPYPLIGSCPSY